MAKGRTSSTVPETVLPVQFFRPTTSSETPEKRLHLAVLMEAIMQLRRGDAFDGGEAACWIAGGVEGARITFGDACDVLGFDADQLARGLLSWRTRVGAIGIGARAFPHVQQRVTPTGYLRPRDAAERVRPRA